MRVLFTVQEAEAKGITIDALRWAVRKGRCRHIDRNVYGEGPDEPTPLDCARASALATGGVALDAAAAVLLGLDGVAERAARFGVGVTRTQNGRRTGSRRPTIGPEHVTEVHGVRCADAADTLIRLSVHLDDLRWEQALESALRKGYLSIEQLVDVLERRPTARSVSRPRIARVLSLRPPGAAPTGSYLETLMVQLCRTVPGLPPPTRQHEVFNRHGVFVARVDLAWLGLGLF
ncbi:MAG TPA: hypothetical protein VNB24_08100, partial [Acidimicrobiales bacterium]|nr:hypothetical protein [Acidimicrobiales bacterium]